MKSYADPVLVAWESTARPLTREWLAECRRDVDCLAVLGWLSDEDERGADDSVEILASLCFDRERLRDAIRAALAERTSLATDVERLTRERDEARLAMGPTGIPPLPRALGPEEHFLIVRPS